ncbi:MAG: hypothetical protein WA857_08090 [Candidatus Acidiferrum sp.]
MRVLFDQGRPAPNRRALQDHTVKTAREQSWSTLLNGDLLRAAEEARFDVFQTTDTNIPYQQNLEGQKMAIVILSRNKWSLVRSRLKQIVEAVDGAKPGSCSVVEIPGK